MSKASLLPLLPIAVLAFLSVGLACADKGLGTGRATGQAVVLSRSGAPEGLETGSNGVPYPLGMPSALKGRLTFTHNCASCHGTYITAAETMDISKQAALPPSNPDFGKKLKELTAEHRWPTIPRKQGPDFSTRAWRFQRTPSQLFQLIAYGTAPAQMGNPSAGVLRHPGPSGRMGEGWLQSIKDLRGDQLVATGDPVPVWNAIFYAWSRSIAAASPARFKDVWDIYGQNCSVCHGDTAQGNGPLARTLNPSPFNFSDRKALAETTDAFLFWRISEGGQFTAIPASVRISMSAVALKQFVQQWSAMPSWRGVLTEDQRWMLVDGVRSKTYEHE
jgi:mono/diheme cytochrome c family protein